MGFASARGHFYARSTSALQSRLMYCTSACLDSRRAQTRSRCSKHGGHESTVDLLEIQLASAGEHFYAKHESSSSASDLVHESFSSHGEAPGCQADTGS